MTTSVVPEQKRKEMPKVIRAYEEKRDGRTFTVKVLAPKQPPRKETRHGRF